MLGYFDDQMATEAAFNAHGWFMTGDLGRIDAEGYLRIAGRKKDVIIRGGHNIDPVPIEALALRSPGIAQAAAFRYPIPASGARLPGGGDARGPTARSAGNPAPSRPGGPVKARHARIHPAIARAAADRQRQDPQRELVRWVEEGRARPLAAQFAAVRAS